MAKDVEIKTRLKVDDAATGTLKEVAGSFRQTQHNIHNLHGLSRRTLYQVIDGREHHNSIIVSQVIY